MNRIDALCMQYVSCNELAKENERKAISLVEEEIESWTTSNKELAYGRKHRNIHPPVGTCRK